MHGPRASLVCVAAAAAAIALLGVEPRARADEPRPADVAWDAWNAANEGRVEVGETIANLLREPPPPEADLRTWAARQRVLFDAALRLRVPLDDTALAGRDLESVVVYLVEGPGRDDAQALRHLRRLDPGEGETHVAWAALGNHLRERRAPGFAAWLLPRVDLRVELIVLSTDDTATRGPPPPPTGHVPGCGELRIPPGFPPVAVHRLSFEPQTGSRVLASGVHPVFVSRRLARESIGFGSSLVRGPARARLVAGWLEDWGVYAAMAAAHRAVGSHWTVDWTGERPWARALQPRIDALHDAWWAMVARLVDAGLLTEEEAREVEPAIRVDVRDERRDTRRPLPPPPAPTRGNPWRRPLPAKPDRPV